MKKVFEVLERLEKCGAKRNPKLEILMENSGNDELKRIFKITYDWLTTFGVRKYRIEEKRSIFSKRKETGWKLSRYHWKLFNIICLTLQERIITGNEAISTVEKFLDSCNDIERKWYHRILQRDLRIGVNTQTISKVWPGELNIWGVQLAETLSNEHKLDYPILLDPKVDGIRLTVPLKNGEGVPRTRSGREYPQFENIVRNLARINHTGVFDGELYGGSWNETQRGLPKKPLEELSPSVRERTEALKFYIFDYIPLDGFLEGVCRIPLSKRREDLERDFNRAILDDCVQILDYETANNHEEISEIYQKFLDQGYEGAMIKSPEGWYSRLRTDDWLKFKPTITVEGEVVGMVEGTGKHKGKLGAFIVSLETGAEARVGSGFTDKEREEIWGSKEKMEGRIVEMLVQDDPQDVATIRFPRFLRFREDLQE